MITLILGLVVITSTCLALAYRDTNKVLLPLTVIHLIISIILCIIFLVNSEILISLIWFSNCVIATINLNTYLSK